MHDITITIKADERLLALGEKILAAKMCIRDSFKGSRVYMV